MITAEMNYYRRRLLALKKRISGDLSALEDEVMRPVGGESSGGLSDVPVHPSDLGTDHFDEELDLTLLENEEAILKEIDDALDRVQQGTFGLCENCHQPIARARLDALPYARYCTRCAREFQSTARD